MKRWWTWLAAAGAAVIAGSAIMWAVTAPDMEVRLEAAPAADDALERGRALVVAGACSSCHTPRDRPDLFLAGGPVMSTPFGDFHVPNITPDVRTGIGAWSDEDFVRAMRNGVSPDGQHFYPIFPYRWYRELNDGDLLAMKAFLDSVPPVRREVAPHRLWFPLSIRRFIGIWKLLNMHATPPEGAAQEAAGAYLVRALGHCGACHTPSLVFAYYQNSDFLGGDASALGAFAASNITPHATGIGDWSDEDIVRALEIGMRPDGTPLRGAMSEYVADSTSRLSADERLAIAGYLRSIPPVEHEVTRTRTPRTGDVFRDYSLVLSVSLMPDLEAGRTIAFSRSGAACAACHASAPAVGAPLPEIDPPFFPILRGQSATYMANRLRAYAQSDHPVMSPIARALSEDEMRDVSDFYAAQTPPYNAPQRPRAQRPRSAALQRGYELAHLGDQRLGLAPCAACHGAEGEGVAPSFPYLAGQPAEYIAAQFAFWRERRRDDGPLGVMGAIARRVPAEDVRALALYYESLAQPAPPERLSAER